MSRHVLLRSVVVLAVATLAVVLPGTQPAPVSAAGPKLLGGGSSYAALELSAWQAETARNPYDLSINYVAQGSTFGRSQYISGTIDFAVSDIPGGLKRWVQRGAR